MTRSGSASKELTYKISTMTSFRFHTNFTNPLKITNLVTSPTKSKTHLGKHRTHRSISTEYSAQNTESVGGDHLSRPLFLCSHSISCWGSSRIRIFKICQSRASRTGKKNCKNLSSNPQRVAAEMPRHPGPRSCCS